MPKGSGVELPGEAVDTVPPADADAAELERRVGPREALERGRRAQIAGLADRADNARVVTPGGVAEEVDRDTELRPEDGSRARDLMRQSAGIETREVGMRERMGGELPPVREELPYLVRLSPPEKFLTVRFSTPGQDRRCRCGQAASATLL